MFEYLRGLLFAKGFFFGSGLIKRVTKYEIGFAGHYSFHNKKVESDPLILDERFIAANVRGRGVTVLSACSHAGIVNVCLAAQKKFPKRPLDLVFGGYHLSGKAMESRIEETVKDLKKINPRVIAPGHFTGWRAKTALSTVFSPEQYGPSVVGSQYILKKDN